MKDRMRRLGLAVMLTGMFAVGVPAFQSTSVIQAQTRESESTNVALTKQQVESMRHGARQRVIVILRNQLSSDSSGSSRSRRLAALRASQKPLLSELREVHAESVRPFTIINAVSARVTSKTARELRHQANVRAVVTDQRMSLPSLPHPASLPDASRVARAPAALKCRKPLKTELAPEALELTKTASLKQGETTAQSYASGKGVEVAFLADGVDPLNQDFVRPDGSLVFNDVEDFTGHGLFAPSGGAEAFGDASSIAAQGNTIYRLNSYLAPAHRSAKNCSAIRILGMAPGASLMGLQIGASFYWSTVISAIQYAVNNGANVINESFGGNPFPDTNVDPVSLADEAAVNAGVVVVASSGDSGAGSGPGEPSTDPSVIGVGGSTSFKSYLESYDGASPLAKGYLSDNVSSLSSSGVAQNGQKSVDVVAPGDLGWALCSTDTALYSECTDSQGLPSPIQNFGGTSESSPLVAGEAALVIQAYRHAHPGQSPSPALVKQIIVSTATDLGAPAELQGAGLINSLKAVRAAMSYQIHKTSVHALLSAPSTLSTTGAPGAQATLKFSLTNDGDQRETNVAPDLVRLSQVSQSTATVTLDPTTDPTFVDVVGNTRAYVEQSFTVPKGANDLESTIAWDGSKGLARLTLMSPAGKMAAYTIPQGGGAQGYGRVDVREPKAGKWTAIIWTRADATLGYAGAVQFEASSSKFVTAGTITPSSRSLAVGQTRKFSAHVTLPSQAGDSVYEIRTTSASGRIVGSIPVILRVQIPTPTTGAVTFSGTILGGNGRGFPAQSSAYTFDVPGSATSDDLSVQIALPDAGYQITGFLVNPEGYLVDTQNSIDAYDAKDNPSDNSQGLQFYWANPEAGTWRLLLALNYAVPGNLISEPFTGKLALNAPPVSQTGVPAATSIPQGTTATATLNITNTGNTTKQYFVDPRLESSSQYYLGSQSVQLPSLNDTGFWVPPQTSDVTMLGESVGPTVPINMDIGPAVGDPDFIATPGIDLAGNYVASIDVSGIFITPGVWNGNAQIMGPTPLGAPESTTADVGTLITARTFDADVQPDTGDLWANLSGASAEAYTPLTLTPGQSGTITVAFNATQAVGADVTGDLYVDTFQATPDFPQAGFSTTAEGGDVVASIPYSFHVTS